MPQKKRKIYQFGKFKLDSNDCYLYDGDNVISLAPKVFDTLLLLIEHSGHLLSKEEMFEEIWADSFVEENNLAQNISFLRKTLGETKEQKFIETVPKRGYRFVVKVEIFEEGEFSEEVVFEQNRARLFVENDDENRETNLGLNITQPNHQSASPPLISFQKPKTQYVQNGDVNIAYQVIGEGEIDIVFVMGWVSHLEYFWEEPNFAAFLNYLASFSRLILFDKRGTGLSDRVPLNQLPTLEQRMEDVHAVMDAVGSEKAVLIGVSEGGPMCSLFAATYPERTSAVVMLGSYAKRIKDEDYPWGVSKEDHEAFFELMQRDWGKPVGIDTRAPTLASDEDFRNWWATYLRMGASPGAAVALTKMNAEIDVRNVLPSVWVPSLVIHRKGDMCLKVEEGRFVASQIPGCKYVELEGEDHLPFVGNQSEILYEIEEFLTSIQHADEFDRVLATVLSVKITDPENEAIELGEVDRQDLLESSKVYVKRQLEVFKGKEVSYNENGILATFDGPARAIRCAKAITDSANRLGVDVKTGLHTGECEVLNNKYGGFAVELAKKIAEEASFGKILVSRTVKDLVAGAGISFEEIGKKSFVNIDGEWKLFKVDN